MEAINFTIKKEKKYSNYNAIFAYHIDFFYFIFIEIAIYMHKDFYTWYSYA